MPFVIVFTSGTKIVMSYLLSVLSFRNYFELHRIETAVDTENSKVEDVGHDHDHDHHNEHDHHHHHDEKHDHGIHFTIPNNLLSGTFQICFSN